VCHRRISPWSPVQSWVRRGRTPIGPPPRPRRHVGDDGLGTGNLCVVLPYGVGHQSVGNPSPELSMHRRAACYSIALSASWALSSLVRNPLPIFAHVFSPFSITACQGCSIMAPARVRRPSCRRKASRRRAQGAPILPLCCVARGRRQDHSRRFRYGRFKIESRPDESVPSDLRSDGGG
jgi:hypothetical protein